MKWVLWFEWLMVSERIDNIDIDPSTEQAKESFHIA